MSALACSRDSHGGQGKLVAAAGAAEQAAAQVGAANVAATTAAAAAAAAALTQAVVGGYDVVFSIVLRLFYQQQRYEDRHQEESRRRSCSAVTGDSTVVGAGDEEESVDCGFSTRGVAFAAGVHAAAVCDKWEGEARELVMELRQARAAHPKEVEFYLPQLCIVIALGDFARPGPLVEFLLELCESDLRIAHKTHWFLKSFCAGGGSVPCQTPAALEGLASFALNVQKRGCAVASRLSRAISRRPPLPSSPRLVRACGAKRGRRSGDGSGTQGDGTAEASGSGSGAGATTGGDPTAPPPLASRQSRVEDCATEGVCHEGESKMVQGNWALSGDVQVQEDDFRQGGDGVTEVNEQQQQLQQGGDEIEVDDDDDSLAEHYDPAMFFVEALLGLAEQLGALSAKTRAKGLHEGLERINEFFLSERAQGSDVIYVPFSGAFYQIRAIHPGESMHFSTKERVPLLVCLEVQEVHVSTRTLALPSRPLEESGAAGVGSELGDRADLAERDARAAGANGIDGSYRMVEGTRGTDDGGVVAVAPARVELAGEGGLMERFRGTVRSFMKLESEYYPINGEGGDGDSGQDRAVVQAAGDSDDNRQATPPMRLGDSIDGDECSSRTASDVELGDKGSPNRGKKSTGSSTNVTGSRSPRESAAVAVVATTSVAHLVDDKQRVSDDRREFEDGGNADCSGSEDSDADEDVEGLQFEDEYLEGASSQGGFWYGEGGGASTLEMALGQWGGDLDVTNDAAATMTPAPSDVDASGHSASAVDATCVGGVSLVVASEERGKGNADTSRCKQQPTASAGGALGAEDESWEIVDAPEHWEGEMRVATAGAGSGSGSARDSQSDSYSEYLAAAEAERRDLAEAEEAEAKLDAEALSRGAGHMGDGVGAAGGPGGGSGATKRAGRHYFAPVAGALGGAAGRVVRRGRRKRVSDTGRGGQHPPQQQQQQEQPRIIFKEQWREKELRVWLEGGVSSRAGSVPKARPAEGSESGPGAAVGRGRGSMPVAGWKLFPMIVKANDDLRQEQFVSHLVAVFDQIFKSAGVGARLRPYEIMATSPTAGVIEAIPDTVSLDALKRHTPHLALHEFFRRHFGRRGVLRQARTNFVESCAAYSVVCYLLQIKDRHNGNLLLSADGHLIHIDWGFALDLSPGGNLGFENAPFKLTQEFVEVMGGSRSTSFKKYRNLCVRAFMEARRSRDKVITLVEMMTAFRPDLACFGGRPEAVMKHLRARFQPEKSADTCVTFVHELIEQSLDNWRTRLYDTYQRAVGGIQ